MPNKLLPYRWRLTSAPILQHTRDGVKLPWLAVYLAKDRGGDHPGKECAVNII